MKRFLFLLIGILAPFYARAENVILMIGDGMGFNHLECAAHDKPLYIPTLPFKGSVRTASADFYITDSAAAATAYSCGYKTNNAFIGKFPNGDDCRTIADKAVLSGYAVGIYSTDYSNGATPSAFYAHSLRRYDSEAIEHYRRQASTVMDIAVPVKKLSDEVTPRLEMLASQPYKKGFFAMFEEQFIDSFSHENQLYEMKQRLYDFDFAVMKAVNFAYTHSDTTVIVVADHETGGLMKECIFSTRRHTDANVPVYAYGKYAGLFTGEQDNTEIHKKMDYILFGEK